MKQPNTELAGAILGFYKTSPRLMKTTISKEQLAQISSKMDDMTPDELDTAADLFDAVNEWLQDEMIPLCAHGFRHRAKNMRNQIAGNITDPVR